MKRYVAEPGSDLVGSTMDDAERWLMCRVGYVEVVRAVALIAGARAARRFRDEWPSFDAVEVDGRLVEDAGGLAVADGLRSLDALHLASALALPRDGLVVATWDARLWRAARRRGLPVLPESLWAAAGASP